MTTSPEPAQDPGSCSIRGFRRLACRTPRSPLPTLAGARAADGAPGGPRVSRSGRVAILERPLVPESPRRNQRGWVDRVWQVYAAAGGLAALAYLLVGAGAGKGPAFSLIGISSLVAVLMGIRLH